MGNIEKSERYCYVVNCYSVATIKGSGSGIGGVVGHVSSEGHAVISGSYFTGSIGGYPVDARNFAVGNYVGGVIGLVRGGSYITNSYSTGTINGGDNVGGMMGDTNFGSGVITHCYSTGAVQGKNRVGGVVGAGYGVNITNTYSTGMISGNEDVGGVAGIGGFRNQPGDGIITRSYSTGAVKGVHNVGGVIGNGSATGCYSTGMVTGRGHVGGVAGRGFRVIGCYSTGAVTGIDIVGGVVGSGEATRSVALNPSVKATSGTSFGRVIGETGHRTASNNVAINTMTNNAGNTLWLNKTANEKNGADITHEEINADGTLGGRFTADSGWVVENGKLPSLPIERLIKEREELVRRIEPIHTKHGFEGRSGIKRMSVIIFDKCRSHKSTDHYCAEGLYMFGSFYLARYEVRWSLDMYHRLVREYPNHTNASKVRAYLAELKLMGIE